MEYKHIPVLLKEVIKLIDPKPGGYFVDCTLGGGGYAFALAKAAAPGGRVLAIDRDELAVANARRLAEEKGIDNIIIANGNFREIKDIIKENWPEGESARFSGIVLDLGLSSAQLADPARGFSFKVDAPLNMAFGPLPAEAGTTLDIVNRAKEAELARIIKEYGEEAFAKPIARSIVKHRPLQTTGRLVEAVGQALPAGKRKGRLHFATKTFQALRIATNNETEALESVLPQALESLAGGGRLAVVSYHSLEDRIVKDFFRQSAKPCQCPDEALICSCDRVPRAKILTKKPVVPGAEELRNNPRSRSAKLRVLEKI